MGTTGAQREPLPQFRPLETQEPMTPAEMARAQALAPDRADGPEEMVLVCNRCGGEDIPSARFCRLCGASFYAGSTVAGAGGGPRRIVLASAAVLGAAALIVAGAMALILLKPALGPTAPAPSIPPLVQAAAAPRAIAPPSPVAVARPTPAASTQADLQAEAATPAAPAPVDARSAAKSINRTIVDPVWVRRPTARDVYEYYPIRAGNLGLQGQATIDCTVGAGGRLRACRVDQESPSGAGFGKASLELAPHLQIRTTTLSGEPAVGRRLQVPIRWRLAG